MAVYVDIYKKSLHWTRVHVWRKFMALLDNFSRHNLLTLSAALAFYTALSLGPLLLITVWVLGILDFQTQASLVNQVQSVIGEQAGESIRIVIEGTRERPDLSRLGGIIGFLTLFFSASGVFAQLQLSLNLIWDVKDPPNVDWKNWIKRRLLSMGMVLSLGFLSAVSLLISTILSFLFSETGTAWTFLNQVLSFAIFGAIFASIYKILPDTHLKWKDAFVGGAITAVLFTLGKELIGVYLGKNAVSSAYGAMGSLMVFLIWVYYSSLTLFLGAELTAILRFSSYEHLRKSSAQKTQSV